MMYRRGVFVFAVCLLGSLIPAGWAADVDLFGFADARYGLRTQNDLDMGRDTISEVRLQINSIWYHDLFQLTARTDLLYDDIVRSQEDIDLESGEGWVDLREFNLLFSPVGWADVKVGRQILTWGAGDLLFINDLFPKDWKSFFAGRDEEYLKAPSDAIFLSMFSGMGTMDIAYMPRFDADRFIGGERFSYWNGMETTTNRLLVDQPDNWMSDDEIAVRLSRMVKGWALALYGYDGYWKSPQGFDPVSGHNWFPRLSVYGASSRGSWQGGIASIEAGYYDSRDDRQGDDPFIPDSQWRFLTGYEHEIVRDLTGAAQYYIEHTPDADDTRHVLTVRLTQMLMNQTLVVGLFSYYSPSDEDAYIRPSITYKVSDSWQIESRGNLFFGNSPDTFFGQFEDNSNIVLASRYSF